MKTTIHLTETDYMQIADAVYGEGTDESAEHVVEYDNGDCLIIVTVKHRIEYRTERGGSYENYDFEMLATVCDEEWHVIDATCYDSEGTPVACDFSAKQLINILN
ncbi:MAG: hypothetical protein LBU80_02155 [Rikenellaceae bacterium]|jgi:hypothetical protein|nr:hypothetical protein [Rikenellaceae bacterium]